MSLFDSFRTAYAVRFFTAVVMLLYLVMLAPFWGSVLLWYLFVSQDKSVSSLLGLTIFLSIGTAWWFARITAHHMAIENQSFTLAFQNTFYPMVMKLAFLPIAGVLFERFLKGRKSDPLR